MRVRSILKIGGLTVAVILGLIALLAGYVAYSRYRFSATKDTHDLHRRAENLAQTYLKKHPYAALSIGLIQKGSSDFIFQGKLSNGEAPNKDTIYEIGSITKVFTTIPLAQLVQSGVVHLSDTIRSCLPESIPVSKEAAAVTLEQLATHSGGFPRLPANFDAVSKSEDNPYISYTTNDLYQALATLKLEFKPGKKSSYSNFGVALLGHLLSLRAAKPFESLVRELICKPLGLQDTAITLDKDRKKRLAPGHDHKGNSVPNWDFDVFAPAGALRSSTADLMRFVSANLNPQTVPALEYALKETHKTHFRRHGDELGLGWQKTRTLEGPTLIWHNGGTGGYVCFIGFDSADNAGVVLLSNSGDAVVEDSTLDELGVKLLLMSVKVSLEPAGSARK